MNERYSRCVKKWDAIFGEEPIKTPYKTGTGNSALDHALDWICIDTDTILDFGCGNGTMLFLCALRGTKRHIGFDLSAKAIENAQKISERISTASFAFDCGGVEKLEEMGPASVDAVILSNIIDNLYPDDALLLLRECKRVLRTKGRILIKLNPHLTQQQINDWGVTAVEGNLLDDGLLLLNNTTGEWTDLFERYFRIVRFEEIYYPEHDQTNRMFLLENE